MGSALRKRLAPAELHHQVGHDPSTQADEPPSRLPVLAWHYLLSRRSLHPAIGSAQPRPVRSQARSQQDFGRMRPRGIEGNTTSAGEWAAVVLNADIAIQLPFSATSGAGCALAHPDFALPIFGRLVWRYSTVNDGVTRFKGILKFSEARRPGCKKSGEPRTPFRRSSCPSPPWRAKRTASSKRRS